MPIYEYRCKKCGSHFERRQAVSDEPLKVCENCDGELEKQWSLSGFSFKGEGWYVTDYAGKKNGSGKKGSGETASSSESTSSQDTASKATGDKTSSSSADPSKA